jgi:hypothetical protein
MVAGSVIRVTKVSSAPVLRPLGVGEVLDAAFAVYRRHAFPLWKLVAIVVALPAALDGAVGVAERQVSDSADSSSGSLVVLQLLVLVVSVIASFLATAAAYRLVADAYLGRPVDPGTSLRFGLKRVGAVMWVSLLAGLGIFVGLLLLVVPGVYLAVAWSVAIPVLLGENLRGTAALGRSRALVRGRFWPCAGVLFLAFLLAAIVALAIEFIVVGITGSSDNDTVIFFTQGISSLISNTLVLPFQVAVTTVLYIDLRVRKEGFDVQLLTHSLEPGGAGET